MRRPALLAVTLAAGCGLLPSNLTIPYTFDAQEVKHDLGADFKNQQGTFPSVDCSKNAALCDSIPNLPTGATAACEAGACVAHYDLRIPLPVALSQMKDFPTQVSQSSLVNDVQVQSVTYWAAANTLNIATPPIDIYVGPQGLTSEAGGTQLGTLPAIPKMEKTACGGGTPGTAAAACQIPLTDAGKKAFGTLARSFKTPFTILLVGHLALHRGDAIPTGLIDLFLQPTLAFVLPLS